MDFHSVNRYETCNKNMTICDKSPNFITISAIKVVNCYDYWSILSLKMRTIGGVMSKFNEKLPPEGKEEVKAFLTEVAAKLGLQRDDLDDVLRISRSSLYGYMTQGRIPPKQFIRLLELLNSSGFTPSTATPNSEVNLSSISLDDLVLEIEKRGWLVKIDRNPNRS